MRIHNKPLYQYNIRIQRTPLSQKKQDGQSNRPTLWWEHVQQAILRANALEQYDPHDIGAIGIAYQMHGLVIVDKQQKVLRNSIIWCDSRAVSIVKKLFRK